MEIIRVENLEKVYKIPMKREGFFNLFKDLIHRKWTTKVALKDINLFVNAGEIVGYIGPNGAGKSTTIKILAGVLHPTSGKVEVNGIVPFKNRIENAKRIALIAGQRTNLYWDLPVVDTFELMKRVYKIPAEQYKKNIDLFNDIMGIGQLLHVPARQLSLGQRIRADFVAALLHNPDIVYLDEPTIGLDIVAKDKVRDFIKTINKERGVTIIITSHDITDIERLCHKVTVIDNGSLIYSGDIDNLKNMYSSQKSCLRVLLDNSIDSLELQDCIVTKEDEYFSIQLDKSEFSASSVLTELLEKGYRIKDLHINEQGLEEVVKEIYNSSSSYK
jgi:ABC-2 type transport system ATP-binding protein